MFQQGYLMIRKYNTYGVEASKKMGEDPYNWHKYCRKVQEMPHSAAWADSQPLGEFVCTGEQAQGVRYNDGTHDYLGTEELSRGRMHLRYLYIAGDRIPLPTAKEGILIIGRIGQHTPRATTVALGSSKYADYEIDNLDCLYSLFWHASFQMVVLDFVTNMIHPKDVTASVTICRAMARDKSQVYGRCLLGASGDIQGLCAHAHPPTGVRWLEVYERAT